MRAAAYLISAALICAASAAGAPLPRLEMVATDGEKHLLTEFIAASTSQENGKGKLIRLDALLGKLNQPTQLRGLVQFFRAAALYELYDHRRARDAAGEAIRLLPDYSAPLLLASQIEAFSDRPGPATDYLLRASKIDPQIVDQIDSYEVGNILMRLRQRGDDRRLRTLSERLLEVGWSRGDLSTTSSLAAYAIEARLERGEVTGAQQLLSKVVRPSTLERFLTRERYRALRPSIESWAGPSLSKLWPTYLSLARAEWEVSKAAQPAVAYARALDLAGHDKTIIREFGASMAGRIDPQRDNELIFLIPIVAEALAREGRWKEAYSLFDRAAALWPAGETANTLNISANRARLQLLEGRYEAALSGIDKVLQESQRWGGAVTAGNFLAFHRIRACALEQLGRTTEATTSTAVVTEARRVNLEPYVLLQLCRSDYPAAAAAVEEALSDPNAADEAIAFMQPRDRRPPDSDFGRKIFAALVKLRSDPVLIRAVERAGGRVLPEPLSSGAPRE